MLRSSFFSALAQLAAVAFPSRAGTVTPAASSSLAGAPALTAPEAHATTRGLLRRSLRACTAEGVLAEVVSACAGGAVLTAWALYLGASALVTGLIVALPQMAQLVQLPAAWVTSRLGHRRACIWLVGLSRQVTLPLVALPFLPLGSGAKQAVLVAIAGLGAVLGVLGNNAWTTWMADLVPRRMRGRYFGKRSGLTMLGGALASMAAGAWLDHARVRGHAGLALASLQVAACVAGAVTVWLMLRQHDPAQGATAAHAETGQSGRTWRVRLAAALAPFRDRSVHGLLVYQTTWNLAVGIAGSFFALHMLSNVRLGFTLVALHGTATAAVRMVAAPMWGRLIDRIGARAVLSCCAFVISGIPFVWLLAREGRTWPLVLDAVLTGVFWGGHSLASFALPLAVAPKARRPYYLAAFATVSGVAFTLATAVGGVLAERMPDTLIVAGAPFADLQALFALSGALRVLAACLSLRIADPTAAKAEADPVLSMLLARLLSLRALVRLPRR